MSNVAAVKQSSSQAVKQSSSQAVEQSSSRAVEQSSSQAVEQSEEKQRHVRIETGKVITDWTARLRSMGTENKLRRVRRSLDEGGLAGDC
jgi:hypothetical protein